MPYTRYLCRKHLCIYYNGYRYIRLKAPVTVRNIKRNATTPPSSHADYKKKRTHPKKKKKERKKDVVRDESIV